MSPQHWGTPEETSERWWYLYLRKMATHLQRTWKFGIFDATTNKILKFSKGWYPFWTAMVFLWGRPRLNTAFGAQLLWYHATINLSNEEAENHWQYFRKRYSGATVVILKARSGVDGTKWNKHQPAGDWSHINKIMHAFGHSRRESRKESRSRRYWERGAQRGEPLIIC